MVLKVCKLPKLGDVKIKKRFAIFPKKIYTNDYHEKYKNSKIKHTAAS